MGEGDPRGWRRIKKGVVGWQLKSLEDVRCKEEEKKAEEDEEKERQWSLKLERLRWRGNRERMEWEFCKILRVWEGINLGNVFFFLRLRVSTSHKLALPVIWGCSQFWFEGIHNLLRYSIPI